MKLFDKFKKFRLYNCTLNVTYNHKVHVLDCTLKVRNRSDGLSNTHSLYVNTIYGEYELTSIDVYNMWEWDYKIADIFKDIMRDNDDINCYINLSGYIKWLKDHEYICELK